MKTEDNIILETKDIKISFGGIEALKGINFRLYKGETLAILGDNGAGKSTLIKIISGVYSHYTGKIFINGKNIDIKTPAQARAYGIETVFQDLSLLEKQNTFYNVFLGRERLKLKLGYIFNILNKKEMEKILKEVIEKDMEFVTIKNYKMPVKFLSGGQRQALAISRALIFKPHILILDEPTAALGVKETTMILEILKRLKSKGISMILISHSIPFVFKIADRIMILREGMKVKETTPSDITEEQIISYMVGIKNDNIE
jgi:ABC-type sugar transport system ATPase subunit